MPQSASHLRLVSASDAAASVRNGCHVIGPEAEVARFLSTVAPDMRLDFGSISPLPDFIRADWLRRSRAEALWGTPENAFGFVMKPRTAGEASMLFHTEKSAPFGFWREVGAAFPFLTFGVLWRNVTTGERGMVRIELGILRHLPWPSDAQAVEIAA